MSESKLIALASVVYTLLKRCQQGGQISSGSPSVNTAAPKLQRASERLLSACVGGAPEREFGGGASRAALMWALWLEAREARHPGNIAGGPF